MVSRFLKIAQWNPDFFEKKNDSLESRFFENGSLESICSHGSLESRFKKWFPEIQIFEMAHWIPDVLKWFVGIMVLEDGSVESICSSGSLESRFEKWFIGIQVFEHGSLGSRYVLKMVPWDPDF